MNTRLMSTSILGTDTSWQVSAGNAPFSAAQCTAKLPGFTFFPRGPMQSPASTIMPGMQSGLRVIHSFVPLSPFLVYLGLLAALAAFSPPFDHYKSVKKKKNPVLPLPTCYNGACFFVCQMGVVTPPACLGSLKMSW